MGTRKLTTLVIGTLLIAFAPAAAADGDGDMDDVPIKIPNPQDVLTATQIQSTVNAACDPAAASGSCQEIIDAATALANVICQPPSSGACAVLIEELTEDCTTGPPPNPDCDVIIAFDQLDIIVAAVGTDFAGAVTTEAGALLLAINGAAMATSGAAQGVATDKATEAGLLIDEGAEDAPTVIAAGQNAATQAVRDNICDYDGGEAPDPNSQSACGQQAANNPLTALRDFLVAQATTLVVGVTTAPACNAGVAIVNGFHRQAGGALAGSCASAPDGQDALDLLPP